MTAHLGVYQVQVGNPTWDPANFVIFWSYVLEQLLSDNELGWTNIGQLVTRAIMVELTNPLWRWISVPSQAVSLAGVEGIQTLSCKFPIAVSIHCSEIPDDIDPWYGNDNIRKFGMVRRKNGLYYGPPIWVNSADFSADLGPPLGDTVEIHMLPGIRYDVWVDPWYGLPPCSFSDGSGVYNYNNGWYFAFGAL